MSNLNLSKIRSVIESMIHEESFAESDLNLFANIAQDEVVRIMDPDFMEGTTTFSTVDGERLYYVKDVALNKIRNVIDTTNKKVLIPTEQVQIDYADPAYSNEGAPTHYAYYGLSYVKDQPAAAGNVVINSSSASDTSQTVRIKGKNAAGTRINEEMTLNGVADVTSTNEYTTVDLVAKSDTTTGYITASVGAVTLAIIPSDLLVQEYHPISLYPVPGDTYTITVRYLRNPVPLINDEDKSELPSMWDDLILMYTRIQVHEVLYEWDASAFLRKEFEKRVKQLQKEQGNSRNNRRKIIGYNPKWDLLSSSPLFGRMPESV